MSEEIDDAVQTAVKTNKVNTWDGLRKLEIDSALPSIL